MTIKTRYYMFILARFISTFGNWFASMAVPFMIYDITGSAMAVSISFLLETLPIILLSPVISYMIDHFSRKIILQLCELISGTAMILCILTNCNNIYFLYIMCICLSTMGFIYNNTINAYIPDICGDMQLKKANTIDSLASNISMVAAPIIAGWCIQIYGYSLSLEIDAITFGVSIILLQFLNSDKREKNSKNKPKIENMILVREGRKLLKKERFLNSLIIICIMFSICGAIFSSLDAVYIAEIFNGSSDVYGYINSAWGIGMLVTSGLYILYKDIPETVMFSVGILIMGISTVGYGLSINILVCVLFNFLGGIANTIYVIYYKSLIQSRTASNNRGKIFTIQSTLSKVFSMIVVFAAGGLADIFTVRASILMSGCITIAIALFSFRILHKSLENVKHHTQSFDQDK